MPNLRVEMSEIDALRHGTVLHIDLNPTDPCGQLAEGEELTLVDIKGSTATARGRIVQRQQQTTDVIRTYIVSVRKTAPPPQSSSVS